MAVNVDKGRREPFLITSKTGEVLPSYYEEENAKLITLLDKYYDFLDSDGGKQNFSRQLEDVLTARDVSETAEAFLDTLISEIGNGLKASSFFKQPRLMARLLGNFYQAKGTLVSAEGFFRGFFNEEVEIEYPKDQIFIVGQDNIGFDSQKFIQDNTIYQIFSILIKSGLSSADYEQLYKRFVHPAGFHFEGQVLSTGEGIITFATPTVNPLESDDGGFLFVGEAAVVTTTSFGEHTALFESDGREYRGAFNQIVRLYSVDSGFTINDMIKYYDDIKVLIQPNSFTFDDSDNTGRPDMAMTFETMDNDYFTRQTSDSAI